jgi:hypothetical protein
LKHGKLFKNQSHPRSHCALEIQKQPGVSGKSKVDTLNQTSFFFRFTPIYPNLKLATWNNAKSNIKEAQRPYASKFTPNTITAKRYQRACKYTIALTAISLENKQIQLSQKQVLIFTSNSDATSFNG